MYEYRLLLASYRIDELIDGEVRTTSTIRDLIGPPQHPRQSGLTGDQRLISVM